MGSELLANKVIVIIGGTTGIGLSAARACVDAGALVVIVGRNRESADAAGRALGDASSAVVGDATDPATASRAIEVALDRFNGFDGLYHVAGGSGRSMGDGLLHELTEVGWEGTLRLKRLAPSGPVLKACVFGPYTLSGRLIPNKRYHDRYALTEALPPIVRAELEALIATGCREITVDEPSMSCYAHREAPHRFVDSFNRTVEPAAGRCRLSTHLCFGNYKGHAIGPRRYAPMFPAFGELNLDEIHLEKASREFAEIELIEQIVASKDVAVGAIDFKSYYIEPPDEVASRVRRCLDHVPPDRLSIAPDCGLSQTTRWAARQKLINMVSGVHLVREELGL